jgi:NADH dehydrogenase [ubiquinone] 1 alpha subcomplex assembly factor 1
MKDIYTFNAQAQLNEWRIVNDGVMGGISESAIALNDDGTGKFSGLVSLANNGGFASVQLNKRVRLDDDNKFIVLRVKGDGKTYEFRLKSAIPQTESYVHRFSTRGEWQVITMAINEFCPQFRGRKLNSPNFNFNTIAQMGFLIANKQEEDFELLIDSIKLQ